MKLNQHKEELMAGYEMLRKAGARGKTLPLGLCAVVGRGERDAVEAAKWINEEEK